MNETRSPAPRWAPAAVAAMCTAFAAAFATWSALRHRNFFSARFDLGNLTQAVWSTAHGDWFAATDAAGEQVSRLGAHVEPILLVLAPIWRMWPSPYLLLALQAVAVASAAIPAYLLARRWVGDVTMSLAFAVVTLLYPALQWATLFDFHPVTLAAPLLLWGIWAAAADRLILMGTFLMLAAATKEQVGLSLIALGIWIAWTLGRRRVGAVVAGGGLVWSALSIGVVMPHFRTGAAVDVAADRYGTLGDSTGEALRTLVTRPWRAIDIVMSVDRGWYLLALLVPLLGLSLLSPLLAAGALPDLAINLLSSRAEQHSIEYHYGAVIAPFLIAAAIRAAGNLRERGLLARRAPAVGLAVALVGACLVTGYRVGPMPFWKAIPGGSHTRAEQLASNPRAQLLRQAVAQVPDGAVVSAANHLGAHLSERRRVLITPVLADAEWVVFDERQADMGDDVDPVAFAQFVRRTRARPDLQVVWQRDGVVVMRRRVP